MRLQRRLWWAALFVLCGAGLAQLQPWFLHWNADFNAHGSGGLIGQWFIGTPRREGLLRALLGPAGAGIFLAVAYLCTLILMTGLHPVEQLARGIRVSRHQIGVWRERYAAYKLARATDQERLEMDRQRLVKEQRRLEKQLRKQGAAPLPVPFGEDEDDAIAPAAHAELPDEFASLPPPKITDNSRPQPRRAACQAPPHPRRNPRPSRGQ